MPPKSCAPTEFDKAYRACIIGIKAFQNVFGSLRFFQRLENLYATHENTLISSVFQTGVIRYAKPFTKSYLNNVNMRYPLENIETGLGFSKDIHDHLIKIRDTLIAHDDFDEIHPRLLLPGLKPECLSKKFLNQKNQM